MNPQPSAAAAPRQPPGLTVAAVARRLGVAPATLRTWDRRYGLGPSEHTVGEHRRYSGPDVSRLDLMRRMVISGVTPADAARAALAADPDQHASAPSGDLHQAVPTSDGLLEPPPGGASAVRGLTRAATALDGPRALDMITDCMQRRGVIWVWDQLLAPTLRNIGKRWEETGTGVEVEHLLAETAIAAMTSVTLRLRAPISSRPVLLSTAEDEMHSLPLFVVAAALAERRVATRVLGARVPVQALIAAIRRLGPGAVLLYSCQHETGDLARLADLPKLRPTPLLLAGGPGWHGAVPAGVGRVHDLTDTVTRIAAVAG